MRWSSGSVCSGAGGWVLFRCDLRRVGSGSTRSPLSPWPFTRPRRARSSRGTSLAADHSFEPFRSVRRITLSPLVPSTLLAGRQPGPCCGAGLPGFCPCAGHAVLSARVPVVGFCCRRDLRRVGSGSTRSPLSPRPLTRPRRARSSRGTSLAADHSFEPFRSVRRITLSPLVPSTLLAGRQPGPCCGAGLPRLCSSAGQAFLSGRVPVVGFCCRRDLRRVGSGSTRSPLSARPLTRPRRARSSRGTSLAADHSLEPQVCEAWRRRFVQRRRWCGRPGWVGPRSERARP